MTKHVAVVFITVVIICVLYALSLYLLILGNPKPKQKPYENDTDYYDELRASVDYADELTEQDFAKMTDFQTNQFISRIMTRLNLTRDFNLYERVKKNIDDSPENCPQTHNDSNEVNKTSSSIPHFHLSVKNVRRPIRDKFIEALHKNDLNNAEDDETVALKIRDDNGKSRVEITLGSHVSKVRNLTLIIKDSENSSLLQQELSPNTVIEIMSNNTLAEDKEYLLDHNYQNATLVVNTANNDTMFPLETVDIDDHVTTS